MRRIYEVYDWSRWRGTKTEAIAFDKDGNEFARATSGFGNILIDFEEALVHIMEVIDQCQKGLLKGLRLYLFRISGCKWSKYK